jgi:Phytanoyl-CoA dioxygenase (PhyH)
MNLREHLPADLRSVARLINQTGRAQYRRAQYAAAHRSRAHQSKQKKFSNTSYPDVMASLRTDSFAVIPGAIPKGTLDALSAEMEAALASGTVFPVWRTRQDSGQPAHLSEDELARGEAYIAQQANIAYVKDPLITCLSTLDIVFSDLVIDIASEFYGALPAITGCNLLKSFVNELPESGYNMFHSDVQSSKFIKFFVYLDDVDEGSGPFSIVKGSHRRKPIGWRINNNRTLTDIEKAYGKDAVHRATARAGDLIVADTTAFHRAQKPQDTRRRALMINTGIHQIQRAIGDEPMIREENYESLSLKQKSFADFIRVLAPANEKNERYKSNR